MTTKSPESGLLPYCPCCHADGLQNVERFMPDEDRFICHMCACRWDQSKRTADAVEQPPIVEMCDDCPPAGYPTDKTRCNACPRHAPLHPHTAKLVHDFSLALATKLRAAEMKYGYSDGWLGDEWEAECRQKLREHLDKGDPRDVANYCAFMWYHGWSTATPPIAPAVRGDGGTQFERIAKDCAALLRRFCWQSKKLQGESSLKVLAGQTDDYLRRVGMAGNILREDGEAPEGWGWDQLAQICVNKRYSDEHIGNVVRTLYAAFPPDRSTADAAAPVASLDESDAERLQRCTVEMEQLFARRPAMRTEFRRKMLVACPAELDRFFMDHGMIHDRKTGKHVCTDETVQPGGTDDVFELLLEIAAPPAPAPLGEDEERKAFEAYIQTLRGFDQQDIKRDLPGRGGHYGPEVERYWNCWKARARLRGEGGK